MCGICGGWFGSAGRDGPPAEELVRRMAERQRHRGPDDEGFAGGEGFELGFRRLSIIDLDTGHQPISNEDGSIWVILNGEIYNFRELRSGLEERHRFATRSDTEVIVHLYEELGDACFERLNGMFGIAILDLRRRRLVLGRDRAGVKPLYYAWCGKDFAFASEVKALLEHPECPRAMDPKALARYLSIGYATAPGTMFEGISTLPPGHRLVLEAGGAARVEPYWILPPLDVESFFHDRAACARALADLLRESVRMRLVSDVPLGALLSGGLDSSIVVGLMAEMASGPVRTVCVGFEDGSALDETDDAASTARYYGTDHRTIRFGRDDALRVLPHLVRMNELPVAEPLMVPSYFLFQEARRHVKVVLSGEGADELFGGYMRYRVLGELRRLRPFLPPASWRLWSNLRSGGGLVSTLGKIGHAASESSIANALWEWNSVITVEELRELLARPDLARFTGGAAYRETPTRAAEPPPSEVPNGLMAIEIENRLVRFILERADKMSMANSLELRTPFLDYRLIEFSRRVPSRWKVNATGEKLILREAFIDLLPGGVRQRRKKAFQSPYRSWLPPMARRLLTDSRLVRDGWIRPRPLAGMVASFEQSERVMKRLWSVLVLEMWYRAYISCEELPELVGETSASVGATLAPVLTVLGA